MHTSSVSASFKQGMTTVTSGGDPSLELGGEGMLLAPTRVSVTLTSFLVLSVCLE